MTIPFTSSATIGPARVSHFLQLYICNSPSIEACMRGAQQTHKEESKCYISIAAVNTNLESLIMDKTTVTKLYTTFLRGPTSRSPWATRAATAPAPPCRLPAHPLPCRRQSPRPEVRRVARKAAAGTSAAGISAAGAGTRSRHRRSGRHRGAWRGWPAGLLRRLGGRIHRPHHRIYTPLGGSAGMGAAEHGQR